MECVTFRSRLCFCHVNSTLTDLNSAGMVTAMDDVIGNLTSFLTQHGMYNDTLFFFTADVSEWDLGNA